MADISRIFEGQPRQDFVLFGDSSHRDPEAYAEIRELYPDRVSAIYIHRVNKTVSEHRVVGMHLVERYAEAAAIASGLGLVSESEARAIMQAAQDEGLDITADEIDELLAEHSN